jgi:hypothetical protein
MDHTPTDAQNKGNPPLLPQHLADLRRSGLSDEMIAAAGFSSIEHPKAIARILGWDGAGLGPCLRIPFAAVDGRRNGYSRLKPDNPRMEEDGKKIKYESPRGKSNRAYFPPGLGTALAAKHRFILITEGEKKAAKASQESFPAVGLVGVWGWQKKRKSKDEPRELIDDLAAIDWEGRAVRLVFDSDIAAKQDIQWAEWHLAEALKAKGATVEVVRLPSGPKGEKVGLDDFLIAHGADGFAKLLTEAQVPKQPEEDRLDIIIGTREHATIDDAIKVLALKDKSLFQRGGELVRIARPLRPTQLRLMTTSGAPKIESLPAAALRTRLTRYARVLEIKRTSEGAQKQEVHPPKWLVDGILAADAWPEVRPLEAVVTTPVLLPDGCVLQRPGYHVASGLLYAATEDFPAIPENPSFDDARRALAELLEPVCDSPFSRPEHRSAWLAATLTPIARFAFHGPAPLFLADANVRRR